MAVAAGTERPSRGRRDHRVTAVVVVVLVAIGFLLYKGLGESTVYFRTADEAVADRAELGQRRFRVEGAVVTGSVVQAGDQVAFRIISAGVEVPVEHQGDPPELFKDGIPVVLEGHWQGDVYASDRILVKHTSEYREQNPDRVEEFVGRTPPASEPGPPPIP